MDPLYEIAGRDGGVESPQPQPVSQDTRRSTPTLCVGHVCLLRLPAFGAGPAFIPGIQFALQPMVENVTTALPSKAPVVYWPSNV